MGGQTMILNTNSTNVQYMFDRQKRHSLELHAVQKGIQQSKILKNSALSLKKLLKPNLELSSQL
jgi:hypothetical protein